MDEEAGVVTAAAQVTRKVEEKDAEMAAWKAPAAMLLVQLSNTGMVLLSKVAIDGGMFVLALLTYRSLFGAAIILPIALLRERCVWFFGTSVGWLSSIPIPLPMSIILRKLNQIHFPSLIYTHIHILC